MKTLVRVLVVGVSALALGCTCPQVKLPASDATPPVLTWQITDNGTGAVQNLNGNVTLTAHLGERYSVKLIANDNGGVHTVSLATTVEHTCQSAGINTHTGPGLASPDVDTQEQTSDGMVCGELYRVVDLDFKLSCPSGGTFVSGEADLLASASNFFNGTSTATLKFNIVP